MTALAFLAVYLVMALAFAVIFLAARYTGRLNSHPAALATIALAWGIVFPVALVVELVKAVRK